MQPHAALEMVTHAALRLVANVLRARVEPEHPDGARSLLARIGVVVFAWHPSRGLEDRAVQVVDQTREWTLGRVSHRVVAQPRQGVADRREHRAVLLATERVD